MQSKCSSTPFVFSHRLEVDDFAPDLETLRRVVGAVAAALTLALCLAVPANATIAVDHVTAMPGPNANVSTLSFSHTVSAGVNRILMLSISLRDGNVAVNSATYGGTALTNLGVVNSGGNQSRTEMWFLLAPPTGTASVVINLSQSKTIVATAIDFTGVNQTTPLGTFASATSNGSTTASVNVTSAPGQLVLGTVTTNGDANTLTVGAGQTQQWNTASGIGDAGNARCGGSTEPGAASVTMSWTLGVSKPWSMAAVSLIPAATTAVQFADAGAMRYDNTNLVEWRTGYEADNLGFNVYREVNGRRTLLTREPLAGSALFAGRTELTAGKPYVWVDQNAPANAIYWVEDIDLNGARGLHGPIVPQPSSTRPVRKRSSLLLSELQTAGAGSAAGIREGPASLFNEEKDNAGSVQSQLNSKTEALTSSPSAVPSSPAGVMASPSARVALSPDFVNTQPSSPLFKLEVDHDGWYRVALPTTTTTKGHAINIALPELFTGGQLVPFRIAADGLLEFYGQALDTPTTGVRTYWLTTGATADPELPRLSAGAASEAGPATFSYTVERRDRTLYFSSLLNGDAENIFGPLINGTPTVQSLNLKAVDTTLPATLEVRLQGVTAGAHAVHVLLGGVEVGVAQFNDRENRSTSFAIAANTLREGQNDVSLQSINGPADISLVDRVRLTYAHRYTTDNDQLRFTMAAGLPAKVTGFTQANVNVFDITDPAHVTELLVNASADGAGTFSISLPAVPTSRTLLALAVAKASITLSGQSITRSNWQSTAHRADLVIITHADFRQAAERLATYRRSQGLLVEVADVADLYNEFNDGEHSPLAIRNFLQTAVAHWRRAPRYVLLVGDATWDPRDYLGRGQADFVPTKLIDTANMETSSDDWLVDFNQDGLPKLSIGRLPVRTAEEANALVSKLITYDGAAPTPDQAAVFVADTGFDASSAEDQALMPAGQLLRVINRSAAPDTETRAAILAALNAGPRLVNFVGHGSVGVWTGAGLLRTSDAVSLSNSNKLSLMIMLTCLNGYMHDVFEDSLGEAMLMAPNGGAAAVWASSGMTDPQSQQEMARRLYEQLSSGNMRLGDALVGAKAATVDQDVRRTWLLLGDPTMRFTCSPGSATPSQTRATLRANRWKRVHVR